MSELDDALEYAEKLQEQVNALRCENAELRKRLQNLTNLTRCKDCRHSVVLKGRLLCTYNAEVRPNGEIWGAVAQEKHNFCMYGQGE